MLGRAFLMLSCLLVAWFLPASAQEPTRGPLALEAPTANPPSAEPGAPPAPCPEYRLLPPDGAGPCPPTSGWWRLLPYRADEPKVLPAVIVSVGAPVGVFANSYLGYDHQKWHFHNEGYFGASTHDGGADKASHFADYYIVSREFAYLFEISGYSEKEARFMAAGLAVFTGLINEVGDGFTHHGFSHEDLVMDILGSSSAALITALRADDLVGVRGSHLPGGTYRHDVYAADLKIAGLAHRLGVDVGPLRFLFASLTYGVKGYRVPGATADDKQRQVGFEVGLNLEEIANAVRLRRDTWWGYAAHVVVDNLRFPYLAVGMRYDLNHHRWHGPNNGNYP